MIEGEAKVEGRTLGRRDSIALGDADSFVIETTRGGSDLLIVETIRS